MRRGDGKAKVVDFLSIFSDFLPGRDMNTLWGAQPQATKL
jgi:hypothetical protein